MLGIKLEIRRVRSCNFANAKVDLGRKCHRLRQRNVWKGKSMLTSFERRSAAAIWSLSLGVAERTKSTQSTRYPVYAQRFTIFITWSLGILDDFWRCSKDSHGPKSKSFWAFLEEQCCHLQHFLWISNVWKIRRWANCPNVTCSHGTVTFPGQIYWVY